MTRFLRFSCIVLLLTSLDVYADSVKNLTNVTVNLDFLPNDGTGENGGGFLDGNGLSLDVVAGTSYSWFAGTNGFAPGSRAGGGTTIYFDAVSGTIGNQSYDTLGIGAADFNAGGLTFPTNGKDFTITVHGSLGMIVVYGCNSQGCDQYNVTTNPGTLTVSFSYADGLYYANEASFVSTTTVPEPSTFALLAIGFGALPWLKSRKLRHAR